MKRTALFATVAICAALPSFADTTLTWNGADGASWTTGENWLDGATPSAWVDGANAVFPGAATVTLDGAVTVSNLTTSGALSIGCETAASYDPFLTAQRTLVFPGLQLADIAGVDAMMGGSNFNGGNSPAPARAYHLTTVGDTVTAQFQAAYKNSLRCVKVEFSQGADGVYARAVGKTGYAQYANNSTPPQYLGCDVDLLDFLWNQNIATSPTTSGYGVYALRASVGRVHFSGTAAPLTLAGGAVTCGATANTTGVLTLSGDVAINLESGSLAFADSSGASWASGKTLTITGNDKLPTHALRFGTSENGLTSTQLKQITYNGEPVALDSSGYLCHRGGLM